MVSGTTTCPAPASITLDEFQHALGQYDQIIEQVSASKTTKPGQKTLSELDRHRYTEAPALFSLEEPSRAMQLEDVKILVEWKLYTYARVCWWKHGKFRPTLMKLVASNDEKFAEETVKSAMATYKQKADASAAVDVLTKLKGIGPATASLLLAVHDPDNVIFFADEAFYWLCCGGKREPIKYNAKEYKGLIAASQALARRLDVKAVDVERVAYALMSDATSALPVKEAAAPDKKKGEPSPIKKEAAPSTKRVAAPATKKENAEKKSTPAKRKKDSAAAVEDASTLRRSKRGKPS